MDKIMRSYYTVIDLEAGMTAYRYALYQAFIDKFSDLHNTTEQRIADQKRVIVRNNLLSEPILQQIRIEVLLELRREGNLLPVGAGEDLPHEIPDRDPLHDDDYNLCIDNNNTHTSFTVETRAKLKQALAEFEGSDPTKRPKLPKLRTNKNTNNIIAVLT